jgi:rhamnulose-1-phosphate aldolase
MMSIHEPYPELDELLADIGKAGRRISEIDASEGAAGNISVYLGWLIEPRRYFPKEQVLKMPVAVPSLAGGTFIVSGSGCRLRDILDDPTANLGIVVINPDGGTAKLFTQHRPAFERLTSEFNSHIAVHQDQINRTDTNFHAIIHAQPQHITYLSHIPRYQEQDYLNRHLLRWQPELIVNLPRGLGVVPFQVPGSQALMAATLEKFCKHRVVIWCKHGLMARSEISTLKASDRIEYVETAAKYEVLNLANGEMASGLSVEEIGAIARAFNIHQNLF